MAVVPVAVKVGASVVDAGVVVGGVVACSFEFWVGSADTDAAGTSGTPPDASAGGECSGSELGSCLMGPKICRPNTGGGGAGAGCGCSEAA